MYELQARRGERIIAKFYRPGRWSRTALEDEHRFLADCAEAEIPVVCPLTLPGGGTCLLYTSDAADDLLCVDLGGRRIIKKKKQK